MGNQQSQSALANKLQARKEKIFPEKNKDKQLKQLGSETKTGTGIASTVGDSSSRVTNSDGKSSSTDPIKTSAILFIKLTKLLK